MILVKGPASVAADRFTLALSDPRCGRIAFAATAGTEALLPVTGELLAALGKTIPREGFHAKDRERARIWLPAHGVRDVIILRADLYPSHLLTEIDEFLGSADARLWALVDRALVPSDIARVRHLSKAAVAWSDFAKLWAPPPAGPQDDNTARDTTSVMPIVAVAADAERVPQMTDAFLVGFQTVVWWGRDRHPRHDVMEKRIRSLLERFEDPACRLSAAQAVALALSEYGWDVTLKATAIRSGVAIDPDAALTSLPTYRDPRVTAAGALWTSGLGTGEIRRLVMPSLDRAVPVLDGALLELDLRLHPYVAAQVLSRFELGARPGDWLFVGEGGQLSTRSTESLVLTLLQTIDEDTTVEDLRARRPSDGRWLLARGIGLRWVPRGERPQPVPGEDRHADLLTNIRHALRAAPPVATCRCSAAHPRLSRDMPQWPPVRRHAAPSRNHPWAYRPRPSPAR